MTIKPEAFVVKKRKARKEHICCECHRVIPVGCEYIYYSGIWDGQPSSYKHCVECHDIAMAVDEYCRAENEPEEFYPAFTELAEWFSERKPNFEKGDTEGEFKWLIMESRKININLDSLSRLFRQNGL